MYVITIVKALAIIQKTKEEKERKKEKIWLRNFILCEMICYFTIIFYVCRVRFGFLLLTIKLTNEEEAQWPLRYVKSLEFITWGGGGGGESESRTNVSQVLSSIKWV